MPNDIVMIDVFKELGEYFEPKTMMPEEKTLRNEHEEDLKYIKSLERELSKLKAKANEWKRYAEALNRWHYNNYDSDMAESMSKPNKPGYYRANND